MSNPLLQFTCPHCSRSIQVSQELAGQRIHCEACGKRLKVPGIAKKQGQGTEDLLRGATTRDARPRGTNRSDTNLRDANSQIGASQTQTQGGIQPTPKNQARPAAARVTRSASQNSPSKSQERGADQEKANSKSREQPAAQTAGNQPPSQTDAKKQTSTKAPSTNSNSPNVAEIDSLDLEDMTELKPLDFGSPMPQSLVPMSDSIPPASAANPNHANRADADYYQTFANAVDDLLRPAAETTDDADFGLSAMQAKSAPFADTPDLRRRSAAEISASASPAEEKVLDRKRIESEVRKRDLPFRVRCRVCDTVMYSTGKKIGTSIRCEDCFSSVTIVLPTDFRLPFELEPEIDTDGATDAIVIEDDAEDIPVKQESATHAARDDRKQVVEEPAVVETKNDLVSTPKVDDELNDLMDLRGSTPKNLAQSEANAQTRSADASSQQADSEQDIATLKGGDDLELEVVEELELAPIEDEIDDLELESLEPLASPTPQPPSNSSSELAEDKSVAGHNELQLKPDDELVAIEKGDTEEVGGPRLADDFDEADSDDLDELRLEPLEEQLQPLDLAPQDSAALPPSSPSATESSSAPAIASGNRGGSGPASGPSPSQSREVDHASATTVQVSENPAAIGAMGPLSSEPKQSTASWKQTVDPTRPNANTNFEKQSWEARLDEMEADPFADDDEEVAEPKTTLAPLDMLLTTLTYVFSLSVVKIWGLNAILGLMTVGLFTLMLNPMIVFGGGTEADPEAGAIGMGIIFGAFFVMSMMAQIAFSGGTYVKLTEKTATGLKRFDILMEMGGGEYVSTLIVATVAAIVSLCPAGAFGLMAFGLGVPLLAPPIMAGVAVSIYPIVLVSIMRNGAFWAVIDPEFIQSLAKYPVTWLSFFVSGILPSALGFTVSLGLLALGRIWLVPFVAIAFCLSAAYLACTTGHFAFVVGCSLDAERFASDE